jgi:hypothetical protein
LCLGLYHGSYRPQCWLHSGKPNRTGIRPSMGPSETCPSPEPAGVLTHERA